MVVVVDMIEGERVTRSKLHGRVHGRFEEKTQPFILRQTLALLLGAYPSQNTAAGGRRCKREKCHKIG